ncbi:hypothetical protein OIU77_005153 [Salix suchowensis]|uniref:Lachrymatory-factor synthase n=1 Tax=Salix suchowensis TaxID=1278906 RepID=A0ABQ9AND8_9ROSI|nr:hypothetical protein OIU77_005153 [Salix suchowensis]
MTQNLGRSEVVMIHSQNGKGKVSTVLAKATADQIWPLLNDFFNLHKWFPGLATCYGIHGTNGEPGCVRYCGGSSIPSTDSGTGGDNRPVSWSTERLTAVDHVERSLSYEIVDSNIGFRSYVSTVKVVPQGDDGQDGCVIEWSFNVDPVAGMVLTELVRKYEVGLQQMAKRMEESAVKGLEKLDFLFGLYIFAASFDYFSCL